MTTTGLPPELAQSGSVLPSMVIVPVMAGSKEPRLMVCAPPTSALAMLKVMVSAPAVLLAASIASRRDILPSVPLFRTSAPMLDVSPSLESAVVVTTSSLATLVTVTAIVWVSVREPSLTWTTRS